MPRWTMQVKDIILATSMHAMYGSPPSTRVEPLVTRHFPRTAVDLETRQLRMLVAISDEGTVTRAASRLNVSQPALSHALRALERSVGDRRSGRAAESARTTNSRYTSRRSESGPQSPGALAVRKPVMPS